jgi:hypothetical protein
MIRVATFNCTLNQTDIGGTLTSKLVDPNFALGKKVAEIVQRIRPDVLLLNEFDYNVTFPATPPQLFQNYFLSVSQNGQSTISYAHRQVFAVNTGISSGFDLDNNGTIVTTAGTEAYGNDCFGFGRWPGQYGMVVFSKFPILTSSIRSFQKFKWQDMPGSVPPAGFYSVAEMDVFRLSSKTHAEVPIDLGGGQVFRFLVSHPTPPSFDGSEDRNGRRNHDEIRLWADCITPGRSGYLKDDNGVAGGIPADSRFVIAGDLNADPFDGDSFQSAVRQLVNSPLINTTFTPSSTGAVQAATSQGGRNNSHLGNPAHDTADFNDSNPGNIRTDYVLPSISGWRIHGGGVFWPQTTEPGYAAIGVSDHRAVWLDLVPMPIVAEAVRDLTITETGGSRILRWKIHPSYAYQIEHTNDPASSWTTQPEVPITLNTTTGEALATDAASGPRRYYRVLVTFKP